MLSHSLYWQIINRIKIYKIINVTPETPRHPEARDCGGNETYDSQKDVKCNQTIIKTITNLMPVCGNYVMKEQHGLKLPNIIYRRRCMRFSRSPLRSASILKAAEASRCGKCRQ